MEWKALLISFPTPEEIQKAEDYFWNQDQIRGFDANGKRIGTGIPRERYGNKVDGSTKVFSAKFTKSHECSHGRPRRV